MGDGIGCGIILCCILSVLLCVAGYVVVDTIFIDHSMRSTELIIPEIELTLENNIIDTIYVYRNED